MGFVSGGAFGVKEKTYRTIVYMNYQIVKNEALNCELQYITVDNEPWFKAKTVALVLGFHKQATRKAILDHVDEEDRMSLRQVYKSVKTKLPSNLNKNDLKTTMINESGLYSLIFESTLPMAKKFKRWVTKEVLPSIRKTGSYVSPVAMSGLQKLTQTFDQVSQLELSDVYRKILVSKINDEYEKHQSCEEMVVQLGNVKNQLAMMKKLPLTNKVRTLLLEEIFEPFGLRQLKSLTHSSVIDPQPWLF